MTVQTPYTQNPSEFIEVQPTQRMINETKIRTLISGLSTLESQLAIPDYGQFLLFSGIYLNDIDLIRYALVTFPDQTDPNRTISSQTLRLFRLLGVNINDFRPVTQVATRVSSPTNIQDI